MTSNYDVKCKRKDKYDVWMDLWVRKHSSQSREVISVCSGQAGSTQLACAHVLLVCKVVCTLMSTFFWLLVLSRMKVTFFLLFLNKGNNQNITSSWLSKFLASSLLYRWGSSPDNTRVGCQSKAIIIISADGQNGRVICNIMNAPIPNFSWSFDIFCGWSSSSCKLHLHNLLWKILVKTLLPRRLHAAEYFKRHLRAEWLRKLSTLEMFPLSHDIRHFSDNRKKRDGIT